MYDKITSGWFYWSYDRGSWGLQDQDGAEMKKVAVLVRPYPRKIAGEQPSFRWRPEQQIFSLAYHCAPVGGAAVTEVYLPPRSWPAGWELVNLGVEISHSFDSETNILSLEPQQAGEVNLIIQAKTIP